MPSERVQRHIDRLLDEADRAIAQRDWALVRQCCADILRIDPDNEDARTFLAAAEREPWDSPLPGGEGEGEGARERQHPPDVAPASALQPSSPALLPSREKGERLPTSFAAGRYLVKRFLGEGGKKRVYLAHDTTLDRDVAFALIKTDGLDDTARERVSREAQAMGRLGAHPHIVTVFDLGTERTGDREQRTGNMRQGTDPAVPGSSLAAHGSQPYMVTELLGGGDVEGAIEHAPDHKLPLPQALALAEQVCQGLEFAHTNGIVHRDLKPGNVWLTESLQPSAVSREHPASARGTGGSLSLAGEGQGEGETRASAHTRGLGNAVAKIGDFGLAVAIDRTRLTQAGMMVGTVSYMPPEQATGGEVTPRSDLYSLGAMLYELVTGRPPFVGDEAVAIIGQHLNTLPVAPTWHRPDCPPGLEALILRLLEKDPSKRPASAGEVREALGRLLEAETRAGLKPAPTEDDGDVGAGLRPARPEPGDNPLYRRAFVGRESELRQLQAAFDAALSGRGSLAMVVGEPGIGKTSVCEQLTTYAALRGGKALVGHCYEEGSLSLPYLPFVEAMRSYVLAREPEGLRSDLGSGAGEVARIVSEVRDRVQVTPAGPHPNPLPEGEGVNGEEQRWRLLQAVSGFLRNASFVQPLLIILEDLHDADRGTLDLLVHLSRSLEGARLLLVGTYRDVEVDRGHPLSSALAELRRGQNFQRVSLRGLTAEEVQRMMASVSQREIPWPFAELVHRQTEGNPLFVQEMLRYLVEEGLVSEQGGSLRRVGDDSLVGRIPEGLRDVIGKRLSRLADKTNQVLSIAAVIGREFRLDVLQRVAGLPEEDVEAALEQAAGVAVVEQRQATGTLGFRFTHAFFRQTLYEEIFVPRRIRLHQQVARALVAAYGRRVNEHAAELAEHFAQTTDPEDLEQALHYSRVAAERAMSVYAYGEAEGHLNQALKVQEVLDPDDKLKRCDLLLALGEALLPAGQPLRAADAIAPEAFALAEALDDGARASWSCQLALEGLRQHGGAPVLGTSEFQQWLERADRYAAPSSLDRVRTDAALAEREYFGNRQREGARLAERALASARALGDDEALFRAATIVFDIHLPEYQEERLRVVKELARREQGRASSRTFGVFLVYLLWSFLSWGERAQAEETSRRVKEIAERTKDSLLSIWWLAVDATFMAIDGRLEETVQAGDQLRLRATELGLPGFGRHRAFLVTLRFLCYLGRPEEAAAAQPDEARAAATEGRSLAFASQRTLALAHAGLWPEARGLLDRLAERLRTADTSFDVSYSALTNYLEAAVMAGNRELAALICPRLAGLAALVESSVLTCVARHLGAASALLGEREQARQHYEQALELAAKVRFRPETALTHLQLAELLLMNYPDERAEALEHLDFAIAEFREMKMQPSLERALRHKDVLKA